MGIWYHLVLLLSLALHNLLFPLPPTPPPLLPSFSAFWLLTHPPLVLHPAPTLPRGRFGGLSGREDPIQQWGLASRPGRPGKVGEATIAPTTHNSIRSWHFQRRVGREMATTNREQSGAVPAGPPPSPAGASVDPAGTMTLPCSPAPRCLPDNILVP